MTKKNLIILIIISLGIIGIVLIRNFSQKTLGVSTSAQCQAKEMIFYYLDPCDWCQKVKDEGTIKKIEQLGVKVKAINAAVGPVRHKFEGVPTFVINEKVYSGYKTLKELKELLGCQRDSKQNIEKISETLPAQIQEVKEIIISASRFEYNPSVITVKKGERIKLIINNTDTLHGIRIPELGIKGNDFVEFVAEKVGEFTWYCNNLCGQDHRQMQGKLIVE